MADLRGKQLKDSYQNVVTRGTGNKLDNGNGVEFADLDDKASLSDLGTMSEQDADDVDITGGNAVLNSGRIASLEFPSGSNPLIPNNRMSFFNTGRVTMQNNTINLFNVNPNVAISGMCFVSARSSGSVSVGYIFNFFSEGDGSGLKFASQQVVAGSAFGSHSAQMNADGNTIQLITTYSGGVGSTFRGNASGYINISDV